MGRAANSLKTSDVITTPIKLKYTSSYSYETLGINGIEVWTGSNGPVTITGSVSQDTLNYRSIRHLYYSNFLTGSYLVSASLADNSLQSTAASGTLDADRRYFPTESGAKITVLSIPRKIYGEQISRRGFRLSSSAYDLVDDGNGNIIDQVASSLHVGNIIYTQGLIIVTNQNYLDVFNQPVTYSVGQAALGGIIAYILQPGDIGYDPNVQHGIVTAVQESPYWDGISPPPVIDRYQWAAFGGQTPASASAIGTGLANTDWLVTNYGTSAPAAYAAKNYTTQSYTDWFLPSFSELTVMYQNRALIGGFATGSNIPPFFSLPAYPTYWSSTQYATNVDGGWNSAYPINFTNGNTSVASKQNTNRIRPCRYF